MAVPPLDLQQHFVHRQLRRAKAPLQHQGKLDPLPPVAGQAEGDQGSQKIDEAYAEELGKHAQKDKESYREERKKRKAEGLPKPTKEEKAVLAAKVVAKTLDEVRAKVAAGQLEATERLNVWLAVLAKVIRDREKER